MCCNTCNNGCGCNNNGWNNGCGCNSCNNDVLLTTLQNLFGTNSNGCGCNSCNRCNRCGCNNNNGCGCNNGNNGNNNGCGCNNNGCSSCSNNIDWYYIRQYGSSCSTCNG